ncbi:MAG: hypothetical protein JWR32_4865 [Mycobacterium sp.]|jgi:hypothetical protein|nr:hypothetical protein [Mycobacterium sp.]
MALVEGSNPLVPDAPLGLDCGAEPTFFDRQRRRTVVTALFVPIAETPRGRD